MATDGEFFQVGVGRHVVARSLGALESHGGFPGFYPLSGFLVAFPWFGLLIPALRQQRSLIHESFHLRFLVAWLFGPLVLLELVQTKLVHYWMPSYPAAILIVVAWLYKSAGMPDLGGRFGRLPVVTGGLVVAALPVVLAVHFRLAEMLAPALITSLVLVLVLLCFEAKAGGRPKQAVAVLVGGTAGFSVVLLAFFLPRLSVHFLGPQAARRALELRQPGERVLVYKARDDEVFFSLPLDILNCSSASCLAEQIETREPLLGVARELDLQGFQEEYPELGVDLLELVDGIDLGHGRWARAALFRCDARFSESVRDHETRAQDRGPGALPRYRSRGSGAVVGSAR
jgi:hypothetical protein